MVGNPQQIPGWVVATGNFFTVSIPRVFNREFFKGYGTLVWYLTDICTVTFFLFTGCFLYVQASSAGNDEYRNTLLSVGSILVFLQLIWSGLHLCNTLRAGDAWKPITNIIHLVLMIGTLIALYVILLTNSAGAEAIRVLGIAVASIGVFISVFNYRVFAILGVGRSGFVQNRQQALQINPPVDFDSYGENPKGRTFDFVALIAQTIAFAFLIATVSATSATENVFQSGTSAGITFPITLGLIGLTIICYLIVNLRDWGVGWLDDGKFVSSAADFVFGTYGLWGSAINGIGIGLALDSSNYGLNLTSGLLTMIGFTVAIGGVVLALTQKNTRYYEDAIANFAVQVNLVNMTFTLLAVIFLITVFADPNSFGNSLNIAANTAGIGIAFAGIQKSFLNTRVRYNARGTDQGQEVNKRTALRRIEYFKIVLLSVQLLGILFLIITDLTRQYDMNVNQGTPEANQGAILGLLITAVVLLGMAFVLEFIRQVVKFRIHRNYRLVALAP